MTIHLRSDGHCYPAVILARGGGDLLLLRVSQATPRTAAIGSQDSEGWYRHETNALTVPSPGGGHRKLDGWHMGYDPDDLSSCIELEPMLPDHTWDGVPVRHGHAHDGVAIFDDDTITR